MIYYNYPIFFSQRIYFLLYFFVAACVVLALVCTQNQISSRTLKIACKIPTASEKISRAMNIEERSEFSLAVDRRHCHGLHNEIKNLRILISAKRQRE